MIHLSIFLYLSPPTFAYVRQWTGSSSVQVMACRLFGAKWLPEPMLAYCQLDSWEQISVKFEFHSRKFIWKCRLPKWRPFCSGVWVGGIWVNNISLQCPWSNPVRYTLMDHCQTTRKTLWDANRVHNQWSRQQIWQWMISKSKALRYISGMAC